MLWGAMGPGTQMGPREQGVRRADRLLLSNENLRYSFCCEDRRTFARTYEIFLESIEGA